MKNNTKRNNFNKINNLNFSILFVCHTKLLKSLVCLLVAISFICGCTMNKSNESTFVRETKELLKEHTLVVSYSDGTSEIYDEHGLKPLFAHMEKGDFKNTYVFDRTTGKASAFVLAYGRAEKLYTGVLSKEAIPILEKYNIKYLADKVVDYIVNKTGDDKCPMEKSVAKIDNPDEAYKILKDRFGK